MGDNYKDPGDALTEAIEEVDVSDRTVRNLMELMYTASERGIINFRLDEEDAATFVALVHLAGLMKKVPAEMRM